MAHRMARVVQTPGVRRPICRSHPEADASEWAEIVWLTGLPASLSALGQSMRQSGYYRVPNSPARMWLKHSLVIEPVGTIANGLRQVPAQGAVRRWKPTALFALAKNKEVQADPYECDRVCGVRRPWPFQPAQRCSAGSRICRNNGHGFF